MYLEASLRFNGAQSISKPVSFRSSRTVASLLIEGERLYVSSARPEGAPVSPSTFAHYTHGLIAAGDTVRWSPNGYKSFNNTTSWASIVHEWDWTDPNYPGHWFFYAKSIKAQRQDSGAYYFTGSDNLPADAARGGYAG